MYKWILKISEYWTKGNIIGWPDICQPNQPKIFPFVQYSLFFQYSLIHDLALSIYHKMINTHYKPRNWLRVIQKIIAPKIYLYTSCPNFTLTLQRIHLKKPAQICLKCNLVYSKISKFFRNWYKYLFGISELKSLSFKWKYRLSIQVKSVQRRRKIWSRCIGTIVVVCQYISK